MKNLDGSKIRENGLRRHKHMVATVFLAILFMVTTSAAGNSVVQGRLGSVEGHGHRTVYVAAYNRNGALAESVPVSNEGKFFMYYLQDGVYSLTVVGSPTWAFLPLHVHIHQGVAVSTEPRQNPLLVPGRVMDTLPVNTSQSLDVDVLGKAAYFEETDSWSISSILGNRFMLLQVFAVVFVMMFPRYLKTLDKETLAELTGEIEPDLGDPNKIIKALAGMDNPDSENEIVPAIPSSSL